VGVAVDDKKEPSAAGHGRGLRLHRIAFGITTPAVVLAWVFCCWHFAVAIRCTLIWKLNCQN